MLDEQGQTVRHGPPEGEGASARPGISTQLSQLIAEVAHAPEAELAEAWKKGLQAGDQVGRFRLERQLGRGGFGVVWEAADRDLGRSVAFKAIRAGTKVADKSEEWLQREAEAVARLHHPNIVTLHDIGQGPTGPYLIFELLRGRTLTERIHAGPMGVREAAGVGLEIARALAHAHGAGVIHRDLKPANVFLCDDGAVKVLDFGLAFLFGRGGPASAGTPAYMAPEQWRSEAGDERVDLFSLGTMLYEMLAGELPYKVTYKGSAALTAGGPPALHVKGVPAALRRLVLRCLEPDAAKRPVNAAVVFGELRAIVASMDGRRLRLAIGAGAVATALATAGLMWAVDYYGTSPDGPRITVAVADVANETGEPMLDGLSGLLITSLEQSHRLQVLSRVRMLDLARQAGRSDPTRIDEVLGQEIAKQADARALLLASVHRFEDVYALELRALQPGAQDYLFTLQEKAKGHAAIPEAIDRLSEGVRRALKERKGDVRLASVEVAKAVTSRIDAYGHYYAGLDCVAHPVHNATWNDTAEYCLGHFEKAVAADPGFALAWYQMSTLAMLAGTSKAKAQAAAAAAVRTIERAPPRERALIRAQADVVVGGYEAALAIYRKLLDERADDKETLLLAAAAADNLGKPSDQVGYLEKVLFLDPTSEQALDKIVEALGGLGRTQDLAARLRQWEALPPLPAILHAIVRAKVWTGDAEGAVAAARRELTGESPSAVEDLVGALAATGDYAAVETEIRKLQRTARNLPTYLESRLVIAVAAQGRRNESRRLLEAYLARLRRQGSDVDAAEATAYWLGGWGSPELRPAVAAGVAAGWSTVPLVFLAYSGDLQGADEIVRPLPSTRKLVEQYGAARAWREGRVDEALTRLRALDAEDASGLNSGPFPPSFLVAEVCDAAGDARGTVAALQRFRTIWPRGIARGWTWPRSLFLLARAHERLDERGKALAAIDGLLDLWKNADEGIPLLAESRALRKRLDDGPHLSTAKGRTR